MTDPTRDAAYALLDAVLLRQRPLETALDRLDATPQRDRSAGHRIAAAVLRRLGTLDAVLEAKLRRAPPPEARLCLLIGAASLLLLDTPPHAAVATAVALTRSRGLAPFAGLVNAVLRKLSQEGAAALDGLDAPRLDTPAWLWSSWGERARAIATAHDAEAPLDITLKPGTAPIEGGETLPGGTQRFAPGTSVTELPGYATGAFWVQDAAAAWPARLLAPRPGERIADLCAAPGGKTAQLAASGATVIAVERDGTRLARLAENLHRLSLDATLVEADALTWRPSEPLDAILLDAPCSATGTIRRHPDVAHLKRPRDVTALAAQQVALLAASRAMLRPGGRLVYAVCSLQQEEGPAILDVARATGWEVAPIGNDEAPPELLHHGTLRTDPSLWPERGGMDGFFAARLVKPA